MLSPTVWTTWVSEAALLRSVPAEIRGVAAEDAWRSHIEWPFVFSSRRRHTRCSRDWSSDVCSSDLKGLSHFNRRMVIHELREGLRELDPDFVFLQEVQGLNQRYAMRFATCPTEPQHEFLADGQWQHAYGRNAVYDHRSEERRVGKEGRSRWS